MSNKIAIFVFAFCLAFAHIQCETVYCMEFYRPDIMQTWGVRRGAQLCTIDKPVFGYSPQIGIKSTFDHRDLLVNMNRDEPTSINKHWRTAPHDLGDKFGVAYYTQNHTEPQILRFNDTNSVKVLGTIEVDNQEGINAFKRTTFYMRNGDIQIKEGKYNVAINWIVLVTGICVSFFTALHYYEFPPFTCAIVILTLGSSIIEGVARFSSLWMLILFLIALSGLAGGMAYLIYNKAKQHGLWVALACTVALVIYLFLNLRKSGMYLIAGTILLVIPVTFILKHHGKKLKELIEIYGSLGSLVAVVVYSVPIVIVDTPSSFFLEIATRMNDYVYLTKEGRFEKHIMGLSICLFLAIVEIVYCVSLRRKLHQTPDSYKASFI